LKNRYDVIVIGGGFAGLCTSAYLASWGFRVLVCEQASETGGYFRSFTRDGFKFDTGLKAVENAGMLIPMLKQLKLDIRVKLIKSQTALVLPDKFVSLQNESDINLFYEALGNHFPKQRDGLKTILRESEKISDWVNFLVTIPNPLFEKPKNLMKQLPGWFLSNLPSLIRSPQMNRLLEVPLTDFLNRFITDPDLIRILTELFFDGTPALFGLGYSRIYFDYVYPEGGLQALTRVLSEFILEHNGEIRTSTQVRKILVKEGKAFGVELADGQKIDTDFVVSASDMKHTFLDLIDPMQLEQRYRERIQKAEIGESAVGVFLGTDIPPEKLPVQHCPHIYIFPDYHGIEARDRLEKNFFSRTPVEMSIPCLYNGSLAPKGQSGIIISALASTSYADNWGIEAGKPTKKYNEIKDQVTEQLINIASKIIPDLKSHIILKETTTPYTYEHYTLNSGGSVCGWTYNRTTTFHRKGIDNYRTAVLTPIKRLFQVGHWTVYPGGAPVCVLTARLAAEIIRRQIKKRNRN
jgi:phytoene dehydrogenase-like protein